jgi:serine/threonine protein kinase
MGLHGEGMDLFDYIELNENMTRAEIQHIFGQIVDAVAHLHRHNIVHRDIKDENVIVDSTGHVQLIDFGSAAYLKAEQKFDTFAGTLDYCAPEVLRGNTYTGPPQDVWSLGILLYTLIYKENPFYNIDEIMSRDLRIPYTLDDGEYTARKKLIRIRLLKMMDAKPTSPIVGSIDLIKHMLDRDVDSRLTIEDVVQHRWLNANE